MIDPQIISASTVEKNNNWQRWLLLILLVYVMLLAVSMIGSGFKYAAGEQARELFNFATREEKVKPKKKNKKKRQK